jgi:hypothetical protein
MKTIIYFAAVVLLTLPAWGTSIGDAVEVKITCDDGRELRFFPVPAKHPKFKAYTEAKRGDNYTIVVRNRLNRRIGVVIAVDGRNIISGQKSWLKNSERMYILEPYGVGEFNGWRTGDDKVNRFYFTSSDNSYAAAFGDTSAMGVIALAVFPEVMPIEIPEAINGMPAAPAPAAMEKSRSAAKAEDSAGTGYGHEEYSPVHLVEFEPETMAVETVYLKYEWHETLCRKGVIPCRKAQKEPENRLWDNGGYAPPPPHRN